MANCECRAWTDAQSVRCKRALTLAIPKGKYRRWYRNNTESFLVTERQILITFWVGNAVEAHCGPKKGHFKGCCWEKTGCLMTADGSHQ